jgi:DNA-binding IclR family transcriptional regulator
MSKNFFQPSAAPGATQAQSGVSYKVPAGEKTIDLIEYMARSKMPQTKSEIAAGVGKSIQEVYRIIQLLVDRGYLVGDSAGDRFSLSMNLFTLAHRIPAVQSLSEAAVGPMRDLVNAVNQSCHLAVLWEDEVIIVSQFNSPLNMSYSVALGARFPAHETSSGLVLLAGVEPAQLEPFFARIAGHLHAGESVSKIRKFVAAVKSAGCDVRPSLMVGGIINISYPVHNLRGETIAALTIPFIPIKHSTRPLDETAQAAEQAARAISYAMGWVPSL